MSNSGWRPLIVGVIGLATLASCDGDAPTEPATALQIRIISGDQQVGPTGAVLPQPLVVRVTDGRSRAVPGLQVSWSVAETGGAVSTPTSPSVTDGIGMARVSRTLGLAAGIHSTTATVGELSVQFTSVAQIQGATRIGLDPVDHGDAQTDTVLATLQPYRVTVRDHNDAPVEGVVVSWTATGDGSVSSATSTTDARGVAEVVHTLGPLAGRQLVHASVPRLPGSPVEFAATARPGRPVALLIDRGDEQLALVNEAIQPYSVRVDDAYSNAVRGVAIDWAVTGGSAIDPVTSLTTDDAYPYVGIVATARHTLGPTGGIYGATATASGVVGAPVVSFMATAADVIVGPLSDDTSFDWQDVVVPVGQTVAWTWAGGCWYYYYCWSGIEHNVTFEDDPEEPVSSASGEAGVHLRTFSEPAVIRYRCTIHSTSFTEGMVGTVTVYDPPES